MEVKVIRPEASPSRPWSTSKGSPWRDRQSLQCFQSSAAKAWHVALSNTPRLCAVPKAVRRSPSPSRQQGAPASAQSILRQARLRSVRSNERFSDIGRWSAHLLGLCGMIYGRHLHRALHLPASRSPRRKRRAWGIFLSGPWCACAYISVCEGLVAIVSQRGPMPSQTVCPPTGNRTRNY